MVKEITITSRKIGVNFNDGLAEILVWAIEADQVNLITSEFKLALKSQDFGYWYAQTDLLSAGDPYLFELINGDDILHKADPTSLLQTDGVHGTSTVVNLSDFPFSDHNWQNPPLSEYIIYELHVGTFTPEGTFAAIEEKLDHLVDLGITAIEIMPVAAFPGTRNWGYDGVFPFAVQESYGGPKGLQQLVNACHEKGLAVILDVVYNHVGPEGNYLSLYGPYFTDKYNTPWGDAINFDDAYADCVRHYFIENVLMWFRDFHIDALRLDAVHAIKDFSAKHILAEIKEYVNQLNSNSGKLHHLIVECDLNDPKFINPLNQHGYGMDAQWADEFHHALRVTVGQERSGYYSDFNGIEHLAKAFSSGYVYDGNFSNGRQKNFGSPTTDNSGDQFVVFSQNHDQVGNRMLGERSASLYSFSTQKLLAGAVLISPFIPLLFMGEEWGETNPFLYFVSHSNDRLIEAVRKGRAAEFKAFHTGRIAPDPQALNTFEQSKLQWSLLNQKQNKQLLAFYKELIHLRKTNSVLKRLNKDNIDVECLTEKSSLIIRRWEIRNEITCIINFSSVPQNISSANLDDWNILFDSNSTAFGGNQNFNPRSITDNVLTIEPETLLIFEKEDV
ncbi:MAG: malto-oligosyltrehalose trehalohydrolase [Pedobacter sp.]|nr:MAG: malto-oligosyltrehalose trehalohydrolase [Pedobacter sp.]